MKPLFKKGAALIVLAIMSGFLLFAEKTPIEHLYSYKLDNGLSVFVAENHSAPLVYIEIAVRTGSIAQTPENAGLFHLYEHMMFKGNPKYKNAQEMQTALNDMGCYSWNGTTASDRVNYFITVPVDQLENGLEYWSYAVREPLMDSKEFEDEKKVVISELQGYYSQPAWQQIYYTVKTLFPAAPWTYDPCGPVEVIQNATISQLRDIQKKYYIPNNAAIFVGGDINPDTAYELVKKIYGNWKSGEDPWKNKGEQYDVNPLKAPLYTVIPVDSCSPQIAQVQVIYRGPDADFNLKDAYVATAFSKIISDPTGAYRQTILKNKNLQIPSADYLMETYELYRHHGNFCLTGIMLNPSENLLSRVTDFYETATKKALSAVQNDKSLDSSKKRKLYAESIKNSQLYDSETAQGLLSNLSYYWCYGSNDFYLNYEDNLLKIEKKDIDAFISEYFYNRNPLITVFVNPAVYEETKEAFDKAGYIQISAENAFWWNK